MAWWWLGYSVVVHLVPVVRLWPSSSLGLGHPREGQQ